MFSAKFFHDLLGGAMSARVHIGESFANRGIDFITIAKGFPLENEVIKGNLLVAITDSLGSEGVKTIQFCLSHCHIVTFVE
jgi:hypothetical protein